MLTRTHVGCCAVNEPFCLIDAIGLFVEWLYTEELPFPIGNGHTDLNKDEATNLQILCLKLSALADRLQCSTLTCSLRRHITYRIIGCESLHSRLIAFAFDSLDDDHPFLQLLVDSYGSNAAYQWDQLDSISEDVPKAFQLRVIDRMALVRRDPAAVLLRDCDYHGHKSKKDEELCQIEGAREKRCNECGK